MSAEANNIISGKQQQHTNIIVEGGIIVALA